MEHFATFRPLTQLSRSDIGSTFGRLAEVVHQAGERGRIHFRILDAAGRTDWTLELGAKASKVVERAAGTPDLEVITHAETWSLIAAGTLSPLTAFTTGRLRVRGDVEMGKRIIRHLSDPGGEVDICR